MFKHSIEMLLEIRIDEMSPKFVPILSEFHRDPLMITEIYRIMLNLLTVFPEILQRLYRMIYLKPALSEAPAMADRPSRRPGMRSRGTATSPAASPTGRPSRSGLRSEVNNSE